MMEPQFRLKEKSVIIHRDENGFGLRVGGQNPVFVDFVHENGAAWKAGVRQNDRIIKVNGTLVKSYDHQRVVQMIQNCTPFVNLTLHSSEPHYSEIVSGVCAQQATATSMISDPCNLRAAGHHLSLSSTNLAMNNSTNPNTIQVYPMHHNAYPLPAYYPQHPYARSNQRQSGQSHQTRRHNSNPHSMSSNPSWLLDIGDDLFQDSSNPHFQRSSMPTTSSDHQQAELISIASNPNHAGVSKLIVSGPNPLVVSSTSSISSSGKSDHRLSKQQQQQPTNSTSDNPYYYYKTAHEKVSEVSSSSCNSSSTASLLASQDQKQQSGTSSKVSSSLSMVRSRSSSKMSIRSTTGKYKPRNVTRRLVEDLRSLTITNNSQTTPSSLSTSPSSSDLSDCDDTEATRLDCLTMNNTLMNNSANSASGGVANTNQANNVPISAYNSAILVKSKTTTRRLEIIRELVDTEKTQTDKLKQLNDLLYKPIKAENLIPQDQLKLVFSCHKSLFKIHRQIYKKLAAAQINVSEVHQEPLVGKALIEIFDGELGKRLEKAASMFCACQSTNTDLLNRITRKDTKSGEFLAQVANQQMLGRLGIKDLLASCFQRLTKYPLLLDNLLKATPNTGSTGMMHSKSLSEGSIAVCPTVAPANEDLLQPTAEQHLTVTDQYRQKSSATVSRSNSGTSESTEESESEVNEETVTPSSAIPETTTSATTITTTGSSGEGGANASNSNTSFLSTCSTLSSSDEYAYERWCIERALHLSRQILIHVNEAVNKAIAHAKLREVWKKTDGLKNPSLPEIDIENQQLLHEGSLTLRLARRSFEVYVILLTQYLVILTREGQDKYKLKYFSSDSKSVPHFSPIFKIDEHLVTRDSATDENGFYLLCNWKDDSRIFEFASQSPTDRTKWKEKIHLAQSYNSAVPNDDNTLTRYTELISLETSSNTPNNVESNHHQLQTNTHNSNLSDNLVNNNNNNGLSKSNV